jgi:hypothetical protein
MAKELRIDSSYVAKKYLCENATARLLVTEYFQLPKQSKKLC